MYLTLGFNRLIHKILYQVKLNFVFVAQDAEIIRTRDPSKLAECDIVVDVGGEFDPKKHRYDHHQRYSCVNTTEQLLC